MDLTDEQWEVLEPLIPDPPRREDRRGRPWRDPRDVLNGILWIVRTGAPWKDLPELYPLLRGWLNKLFRRLGSEAARLSATPAQHAQNGGAPLPASHAP